MEIADIFVAHRQGDVRDALVRVLQEPGRPVQPPLLLKLRVGPARAALDLPAEPGHVAVEHIGRLRQAAAHVAALQVFQQLQDRLLLPDAHGQLVALLQKLDEEQTHGVHGDRPAAVGMLQQMQQQKQQM